MSRIRSQLDTILAGNTQAAPVHAPAPRMAYERQGSSHQQPVPPHGQMAQPISNAGQGQNASTRDLNSLQSSLAQLSQRINAIPRQQPDNSLAQYNATVKNAQSDLMNEIKRGYDQISSELAQLRNTANPHLESDLKRIADGIAMLQNNQSVHPDYLDQMQSEFATLHNGLNQLINTPPSQVDLSGVSKSIETGYSDIVNKLDQVLSNRGNEMPAIEMPDYDKQFNSLHQRMEEITRAVVSMTVSPAAGADQHALERIEARLASLSKSVDEVMQNPGVSAEAILANQSEGLNESVAAQIAQLSDKIDNIGVMSEASSNIFADVQGIVDRLDTLHNEVGVLATSLEQNNASESVAGSSPSPDLTEVEQRLAHLADRFDEMMARPDENPNTSSQEILQVLQEMVGRVEKIEQIATQSATVPLGDDRLAGLENQLASIASQLGNVAPSPEGVVTDLAPINERLDHIEGQIVTSRDIILDIVSEAVQKAAGTGNVSDGGDVAYSAILEELRMLREGQSTAVQGGSSENQLADISNTINSIAGRLAELEAVPVAHNVSASENAMGRDERVVDATQTAATQNDGYNPGMSDYAPEAEPASEYLHTQALNQQPLDDLSSVNEAPSLDMSNLDHAVEPEFESQSHSHGETVLPEEVGEGEDVPLAPGSQMPDLETLVRNATERKKSKKSATASGEEENGTSELLAAARRAAQMASLEANNVVESPKKKKAFKKPSLPSIKTPAFMNKKTLMMSAAVALVAIGGFVLAPKFFGSDPAVKVSAAVDQNKSPKPDTLPEETATPAAQNNAAKEGESTVRMVGSDTADAGSALLSPEPVAKQNPATFEQNDKEAVTASLESAPENVSMAAPQIADIPEEIGNSALRTAISAGDGDALFEAGRRYTDGDGVERNLEKAVDWYRKAAEAGHVPSQYRLGNFYEKGHGLAADQKEAAKWYSKAAAAGNALAMHNLAVLNAMGVITGEPDMTTAVGWFEKAADMGVKDSQVNLGILYTKGMGVDEDLERAYKWFAVAAKGGDNDAAKKRDTVAQAMRPEQLEKARGEAELWKPAKLDQKANIARIRDEWKSGTATKTSTMSKADVVKQTQMLLTKAGFDAGAADGQFGKRTRNAIMGFQKKMGMKQDGKISKKLLEALSKTAI